MAITTEQLEAMLAAANARAEHSETLLCRLFNASPVFNRDSLYQDMKEEILALRDDPAPGVTPKIEVKFTWAKCDEEFWVHLKSPDGKSAGFNLGNPKGMIATALLRAIAGGGDE